MAAIPDYWAAVEAAQEEATTPDADRDPLDFNIVARAALPPLLGLPVDVDLGKTSSARAAIAELIATGGLGTRKVVYAVPRHDLGAEQVAAFEALGISAMLWKGRTAPDPTPENPDQLMCLDTEATFDALEIEHPVEQSCCKVKNGAELLLCPLFHDCGYQRQKPPAQAAQVIVCAHDSLFHMKPQAIGEVGLLVIDEAFWQSGLRGLDGKATLTQDGLEPGRTSLTCYNGKGKMDVGATADLIAARERLCKALRVTEPGPLRLGLLEAVGLTPEDCRHAATLERRRMRDAGLRPGMSPVERRKRIEAVLPPAGEPWAPPGRCTTLWLILAEALENGHDAAGAELVHEMTEAGSVRALRLRWRSPMRTGWAAQAPILHLDATLRPELVQTYLPRLRLGAPVAARQPHVRVRQVTGSPTAARALTPSPDAPERDRKAAATRLRDLRAWIDLRARQCHLPGQAIDLLVVGQKAAIDALRSAGPPPRVEAVHYNALSGLDRWGGMVVLGRTLPAPRTVELIATAVTGRVPARNPEDAGWWYPMVERRIRLAGGRTAPLAMEEHADPIAEAVRWCICEGDLAQAMGRGRGVNRSAATPLEIDLLTDVVLPVTVDALVPWSDPRPTRRDLMALSGVVLENAADMAACFLDLWSSGRSPAGSVEECDKLLLEPLARPPDLVEADEGARRRGEGPVDVGAALAADREPSEAGEPSQGSFDDPAVAAEAIRALDAAAGDARRDRPLATFGSAAAVVAGLVGVEPLRAATGSAPAVPHARDDVEHGGQHAAVVPVGPAQLKAERRPAGVDHEVALGAWPAAVRGVRADLRVRRRAPPFAAMVALSIDARLQSSASAAARRSSSTRCRSPSTPFGATLEPMAGRPSPCQSRSRRQQSLPRTPIRGHARAAEPLPRQHRPGDARAEHEHDALQGRPVVAPVVASCPPALRLRGLVGQQRRHRRP